MFVGRSCEMSLIDNKTASLWGCFAPRISEIFNRVGNDKFSLQIYDPNYFTNFSPVNEFVKWAAVEVSSLDVESDDMETLVLSGGTYAVFDYKGSSNDSSIFEYIYTNWLPNSDYMLCDRPHFEVLGEKYINNDPNSEEEIWIPIQPKAF